MAGLWIGHIEVTDAEGYARYIEGSSKVIPAYDGQFIARGGRYQQKEGKDYPRNVVIRFPTYDRALECYESEEYQAVVGQAKDSSNRTVVIVESDD
jgi:uncharacterized protein (DUF1330 family)